MLMFDNILFATFIPQILMLFGVIMCVVSSAFASDESVAQVNETIPEAGIVNYLQDAKTLTATYDYFSDSQGVFQHDIFSQSYDESESLFYLMASNLKFPKTNTPLRSKTVNIFFFTRPPPCFV